MTCQKTARTVVSQKHGGHVCGPGVVREDSSRSPPTLLLCTAQGVGEDQEGQDVQQALPGSAARRDF